MLALRAPSAPRTTERSADDVLSPGVYLTDGHHLFRIVSRLAWGDGGHMASLEDCRSLVVAAYTADELHAMRLRLVKGCG